MSVLYHRIIGTYNNAPNNPTSKKAPRHDLEGAVGSSRPDVPIDIRYVEGKKTDLLLTADSVKNHVGINILSQLTPEDIARTPAQPRRQYRATLEKVLDWYQQHGGDLTKLPRWLKNYILVLASRVPQENPNPYGRLAQAAALGLGGIIGVGVIPAITNAQSKPGIQQVAERNSLQELSDYLESHGLKLSPPKLLQESAIAQSVNVQPIAGGNQGQELKGFSVSYDLKSQVVQPEKLREAKRKLEELLKTIGPIYKASLRLENVDNQTYAVLSAEGIVPIIYLKGNKALVTGYAKIEGGKHSFGSALGVVIYKANDNSSIDHFGIVYHHFRHYNTGTDHGALEGVISRAQGPIKVQLNFVVPYSGAQTTSSRSSTKEETKTTTSDGNEIKTTKEIRTTEVDKIAAVQVISFTVDYDASKFIKGLTFTVGGRIIGGIEGVLKEESNKKTTREGIAAEKKIILGASYNTGDGQIRFLYLIGDGQPIVYFEASKYFGPPSNSTNGNKGDKEAMSVDELVALLMPRLEGVKVRIYTDKTEETTNSLGLANTCKTTGKITEEYTCTVNVTGGKISKVTGIKLPSYLSLSHTETSFTLSGKPGVNDVGTRPVEVDVEGSLKSTLKYDLKIDDIVRVSATLSGNKTSCVAPCTMEYTLNLKDGKGPFKLEYDNGDGTKKTVTITGRSDKISFTYNKEGNFTTKVQVTDESLESKVTASASSVKVVSPLEATCSGSPTSPEIGQAVTYTANVSGGTGTNTFSWSGDASGTTQAVSTSYTISGKKTATVNVTSNGQSASASCSVNVLNKVNISINDVTVTEGNSGTTNATFTVSLSRTSNVATTINFTTQDGTATAGTDYNSTSGTLTIPSGSTSGTITIQVIGDTNVEPDETFKVKLSNPPAHATITDDEGVGTIQNDDVAPPPEPPPT